MILMSCLLLLSLLTFLSRTKMNNTSAVVDNVRYIYKSAADSGSDRTVKNYEFYFVDDTVMKGTVSQESGGSDISLYVRGEREKGDGGEENEYEWHAYAYEYTVSGSSKKDSQVTWRENEYADASAYSKYIGNDGDGPYARFTENVFKSMIFGTDPMISVWQALTVGVIALSGGAVIVKAEELWHIIYKKPEDDTPVWEDMNGIKRTGIGILIFDAALLILFIFI